MQETEKVTDFMGYFTKVMWLQVQPVLLYIQVIFK